MMMWECEGDRCVICVCMCVQCVYVREERVWEMDLLMIMMMAGFEGDRD